MRPAKAPTSFLIRPLGVAPRSPPRVPQELPLAGEGSENEGRGGLGSRARLPNKRERLPNIFSTLS